MNKFRGIIIATLFVVVAMVSIVIVLGLFQREGTPLLFDGKTTSGWVIEGNGEVKDGALILGGNQKTWARIAADFSPRFELHLEYSTENNKRIQIETHHRHFLGHGSGSMSLERTSKKPGEWIEAVFSGKEDPAGNGWVTHSKWRAVGDAAFTDQPLGGAGSVPSSAFVAFEIPAGQKLYLRNVRAKTESVNYLPWLLLMMSAAVVGVLVVAAMAYAIMRKRGAALPKHSEVPAPPS